MYNFKSPFEGNTQNEATDRQKNPYKKQQPSLPPPKSVKSNKTAYSRTNKYRNTHTQKFLLIPLRLQTVLR